MTNEAYLLYPHQLFEEIFIDKKIKTLVLVEEPLFFTQLAFHKKKLVFHRASMKAFEKSALDAGFKVLYIESKELKKTEDISLVLQKNRIHKVHLFELVDCWLEKKLKAIFKKDQIKIVESDSPSFYLTRKSVNDQFSDKKHLSMAQFYISQRKSFNILVDEFQKPLGGKWSLDSENRKKLPKGVKLPTKASRNPSPFVKEAMDYVEKRFKKNYGVSEDFVYPVTHKEAKEWLEEFLEKRFSLYGDYQDAICSSNSTLFHSLLSPLMNVGLLKPDYVINQAIDYAKKEKIPLNSLEGFIRQIVGWREFVRGVYSAIGSKERTKNFFNHKRKLPPSFWTGTTSILPIDNVISKVLETAYTNHIERLMVVSNFMLLCEIDPDEVYRWFMELFIDAYDWVMVPNVYGMGLYADGGMITTKPYVSGANYIFKMSDFEKGEWADIWNSLYWNFIDNQKAFFKKNPRSGMMVSLLEKMDTKVLARHKKRAADFLKTLDG